MGKRSREGEGKRSREKGKKPGLEKGKQNDSLVTVEATAVRRQIMLSIVQHLDRDRPVSDDDLASG